MPPDTEVVKFAAANSFLTKGWTELVPHFFEEPAATDWGFDLEIDYDLLSVFAYRLDDAGAVTRMPVMAVAVFGVAGKEPQQLMEFPLGVVGTDHIGYCSFDLTALRHVRTAAALRRVIDVAGLIGKGKPRPKVTLTQLWVLPYKEPTIRFDALVEGYLGPGHVVLRMPMDEAMLTDRAEYPPMLSMQTPGIADWRISPGSFSMSGALLIGEDGCETLVPASLATQMFRFHQTIRTAAEGKMKGADQGSGGLTGSFRLGYNVEYKTEWFSIGHSLGRISYSLPLAPGEKIKIAVIDWARQDETKRDEDTKLKETLDHRQVRDQSLAEAVQMVVSEHQSGSSSMAGLGSSGGAGVSLGYVDLGFGHSWGIGEASSSSSGIRTVTGDTTRSISDSFHQASSALRELNSSVVVQGTQAEQASAQTRVVANYNHSHALTILYYEVLHHNRVLTRPSSARPLVLLQQGIKDFDYDLILKYRDSLESRLRDQRVKGCFDVVAKRQCLQVNLDREKKKRAEQGDPLDDTQLGEVAFWVRSGDHGSLQNSQFRLVLKAGGGTVPLMPSDVRYTALTPYGVAHPDIVANMPANRDPGCPVGFGDYFFKANAEFILNFHPAVAVRWKNVEAIEIAQTIGPATGYEGDTHAWVIDEAKFETASGSTKWVMFKGKPESPEVKWDGTLRLDVAPIVPPVESVDDLLSDAERCCLDSLLRHLNDHSRFYWQGIWEDETPADRAGRLGAWTIDGRPLLDIVENRLVDVIDDYIALPVGAGGEHAVEKALGSHGSILLADLPTEDYIEQILTLPTRGVFAEAKLGHCNASELIDTTRFWDWQTSPIPDSPPEISPVDTDSRYQKPDGITPTPFPTSLINIVNPQQLPEPAGLNSAAGVLSALGPFRDMSGMKELGSYLQTLSNNATQLAAEGLKGAQVKSLLDNIRGAKELTPQQKTELIGDLLTGQVKNQASPTPKATTGGGGDAGQQQGAAGNNQAAKPAQGGGQPATPTTGQGTTPTGTGTGSTTPTPKPKPTLPTKTSPKTKTLTITFVYDTHEEMVGAWTVRLMAAGYGDLTNNQFIDPILGASGRNSGSRMEFPIPEGWGGDNPVTIQVDGAIKILPTALNAGRYAITTIPFDVSRRSSETFTRANFDKTSAYEIVQKTEAVQFKVAVSVQDKLQKTEVTSKTGSLEVGVSNSTEVGGNVGVAEGKENLTISGKAMYGVTVSDQKSTETANGKTDEISFTARRIDVTAPPRVTPVQ